MYAVYYRETAGDALIITIIALFTQTVSKKKKKKKEYVTM